MRSPRARIRLTDMTTMGNMGLTCASAMGAAGKHGGNHAALVENMTAHVFQTPTMFSTMFSKTKQQVRSMFPMISRFPCV